MSLFAREVVARLALEGHPIAPGTVGENMLIEGLDWGLVVPGARLRFAGGVELEVASFCRPCKTIAASFIEGRSERIAQDRHPGDSRVYARVLATGPVRVGDTIAIPSG